MLTDKKGQMFILSSPSGAGKTTLTRKIEKNNSNFSISISHTTRKPRPNEINKKDYYFVSKEEFDFSIKKESFLEYAKIFDNYYGTHKDTVTNLLNLGKDVLLDIDWQGTQQLKKNQNFNLVTFFILPPNKSSLKKRLIERNQDNLDSVSKRLDKFEEEVSHWNEYNYVLINDDLETCYNELLKIIKSVNEGKSLNQDMGIIKSKIQELIK